jgi:myo-inositol 2-dehydrogenase / D-chiro-inositol 1-dehydrogenase
MERRRNVLGVGIIGCGYAAQRLHLPALRSLPATRVVAIADTDPERLRLVAGRFAIARRYQDHEALLRDPEVDAVAVCVPPRAHAPIVLAALDAKKHVLVEKPLCLELDEADRLVERAARTSVTAMVGFNLRFHRHVRAARQAIAQGLIGPIELVRSLWTSRAEQHANLLEWRRRRELGGGVLHELAVHHVDLWRFLVGSEIDEVFTFTRAENFDDQTATLSARLRNGALAVSGFSQRAAEAHEIEVYGEQGRLLVSPYRFDGFDLTPASMFAGDLSRRARTLLRTIQALPGMIATATRGGSFLEAYRAQWQHFAESALHGAPAECTFDDGRQALEFILAAIDSIRSGRPTVVNRTCRLKEAGSFPG